MRSKVTLVITCLILTAFLNAQEITVNQLGYLNLGPKTATVPGEETGAFQLIRVDNEEVVYSGELSASAVWSPASQSVRLADFSDFTESGTYRIEMEGSGIRSHDFRIGPDIYEDLARESMRFFYLSRVSMPLEDPWAGDYARPAGHPDTAVIIHSSAASAERPTGSTISTPGGWYDAGDYNKYVVNAGISNYTVFAIAEHFPEFAGRLDLNIPESSNGVPDVIDEAVYNLRWMLSMQDPHDGGVYHKCTHLQFTGFITPSQAAAVPRYVVMKSTAATLDMAAVAAQASRILEDYEAAYPGLSDSCLAAAELAYTWAQNNPNVIYQQPSDVGTGSYGDGNLSDEFRWAAMELYITTGNEDYLNDYDYLSLTAGVPGWPNVYSLGLVSLYRNADRVTEAIDMDAVTQKLIDVADDKYDDYMASAYGVPATVFGWGSNSNVANAALMSLQAYDITGDDKYLETVLAGLDYLLGRNPTRYSFVTGFGSLTPMYPHDRKSSSDGVVAPIPGMLVGGPNPGNVNQDCGASAYPSTLPALAYLDDECSYSTNEITINWNAPLAYAVAGIQSLLTPRVQKAYTGAADSSKVYVSFDIAMSDELPGTEVFELTRNNGEEMSLAGVSLSDERTLALTLSAWISKSDTNLLFSYTPGTLKSLGGAPVDTISDLPVTNLVYGSPPVVTAAYTDDMQDRIYIEFTKKMADPATSTANLHFYKNSAEAVISAASLFASDSLGFILDIDEKLMYADTLWISYTGTELTAYDGGLLSTIDSLPVENRLPTPPELTRAFIGPAGDFINMYFSKNLADTSVYSEDFSLTRNDDVPVTLGGAIPDPEDARSLTLEIVDLIDPADTNILLSYSGTRLISEELVPVKPFGPVEVENKAAVPHVLPGTFEAEDYLVNNGYQFEACSDEGGGLNLGYADEGDYIDYYVDVTAAGEYTVTYRVASNLNGAAFELSVVSGQHLHDVEVPNTGGWQSWENLYKLVNMDAGDQVLRITALGDGFNINWIRFEEGNTVPPESVPVTGSDLSLRVYPVPVDAGEHIHLRLPGSGEGRHEVKLTDLTGKVVLDTWVTFGHGAGNQATIRLPESLDPGLYIISVRNGTSQLQQMISIE